jgi:hypothetical protein
MKITAGVAGRPLHITNHHSPSSFLLDVLPVPRVAVSHVLSVVRREVFPAILARAPSFQSTDTGYLK